MVDMCYMSNLELRGGTVSEVVATAASPGINCVRFLTDLACVTTVVGAVVAVAVDGVACSMLFFLHFG